MDQGPRSHQLPSLPSTFTWGELGFKPIPTPVSSPRVPATVETTQTERPAPRSAETMPRAEPHRPTRQRGRAPVQLRSAESSRRRPLSRALAESETTDRATRALFGALRARYHRFSAVLGGSRRLSSSSESGWRMVGRRYAAVLFGSRRCSVVEGSGKLKKPLLHQPELRGQHELAIRLFSDVPLDVSYASGFGHRAEYPPSERVVQRPALNRHDRQNRH